MKARALNNTERRDWLRLSMSENVGPQTFRALMKRFGSAAEALAAIPGLSRKGGLSRAPRLYGADAPERDIANADAMGARFVAFVESDYPALSARPTPPRRSSASRARPAFWIAAWWALWGPAMRPPWAASSPARSRR